MSPLIGRIAQAVLCVAVATGAQAQAASTAKAAESRAKAVESAEGTRQLTVANKPWTGDFDQMLERRMIRVYAPYSRSLYYVDKGRERGIAAELVRDFERWVNQKYAKQLGKRPLTVYIVAATRDTLAADLNGGLADIAVGYLSATEEHLKVVDFVAPDEKVSDTEILVTGPASPAIASIDDLGGKTVHVRKSSSYYESLTTLNDRLTKAGKQPVKSGSRAGCARGRGHAGDDERRPAPGNRGRRVEGEGVGAGTAEGHGPRDHCSTRAHQEGVGDPQEQSAARRGAERLLRELGEEGGGIPLPATAIHEEHQDPEQSRDETRTMSDSSR